MQVRSARPLTKVQAGFVAGAAITILVFLLKRYGNLDLPPDVIAALTFLLTCAVAYVVPLMPGEIEPVPLQPPVVFGNGGTVVAPEFVHSVDGLGVETTLNRDDQSRT